MQNCAPGVISSPHAGQNAPESISPPVGEILVSGAEGVVGGVGGLASNRGGEPVSGCGV